MSAATWKYRTNTTINDPNNGNVRFNAADLTLATSLAIAHKSQELVDARTAIAALAVGDLVTMTSTTAAHWVRYAVTTAPVMATTWSEIAVSYQLSDTPTFTDAESVTFTVNAMVLEAPLVTMTQAKAHLRITTPDGHPDDPDIQLKLDQAEAIIRNYLKKANDPTWTADTVPPPITAAILLMLGRLYEQRGDFEDNDAKLWQAIDRLLARYHTPAIA